MIRAQEIQNRIYELAQETNAEGEEESQGHT